MTESLERVSHATDWITFLVIIIALIYGLMHYYDSHRFTNFIKQPFNKTPTFEKTEKLGVREILLELNFFLITSLFFLLFLKNSQSSELKYDDWILYLKIILGLAIFLTIQRLVNSFHSFITDSSEYFDEYIYSRTRLLQWSAFAVYPLVILSIYAPFGQLILNYASLFVFVLAFIFGLFKTLPRSLSIQGHFVYHNILYLCAVEILPLILLYKLLI